MLLNLQPIITDMHILANHSLKKHNTFNFDVRAKYFIRINNQSDIPILLSNLKLSSLPWVIIGDGSNLLLTGDIDKVVVSCGYKQLKVVKEDADTIWLSVGAGMNWHELVTYTVEKGYWGLENLALIPGTVGAAPVQNIGAYGAEARDTITRVQALNLFSGERVEFRNADCEFEYRNSIFKKRYLNQLLVHRITIRLRKRHAGSPNLVHTPLIEAFESIPRADITPKMVYDEIIRIRKEKLPNPEVYGNAGSYFTNPVVSEEYFNQLVERLELDPNDIPHHRTLDNLYKLSAAWLIEQAGWKGKKHGNAAVSEMHSLVLINTGEATGLEVSELAKMIQKDIDHRYGIHLETEVIEMH